MLKALVTRLGKIVFDFSITSEATLAVELAGALSRARRDGVLANATSAEQRVS